MEQERSWSIIDPKVAIKHTDLSFFKHHGSGIPIKIRYFFDIEDMVPGENRQISIIFNNEEYKGRLNRSRSTTEVTRIFWTEDLSSEFNKMFPGVIKSEDYPDIEFVKESSDRYIAEFIDYFSEGEFGVDDETNSPDMDRITVTREGKKIFYYTTRYERNQRNRDEAIALHGKKCMACGFDFEKTYGERGRNFIEVHHVKPLSSINEEVVVDPENDLICVCSNCHRMIHRSRNGILSLDELKHILEECAKNKETIS